jgi:RimJ/RimL family protein N-acetyltransferase
MFSIFARENLELIGHGGLVDIDEKRKNGQLRTTIGNPAFWGKGYGTEATTLIVAYGFGDLALGNIWLRVAEDNVRAIRSYIKVGFREEGREEFQGEEFLRMSLTPENFMLST